MTLHKKILLSAISAALALPGAAFAAGDFKMGVTLSPSIDYVDSDTSGDASTDLDMSSNESEFWFSASEEVKNGLKALIYASFEFDMTDGGSGVTTRDNYFGLDSNYGKVIFGSGSTSYKSSGAALDPLWQTSLQARGFSDQVSALQSGNDRHRGRMQNLIRYDSPSWNGTKFIGWVGLDETAADEHEFGAGVHYTAGNLFAAIDYWNGNCDPTADGLIAGSNISNCDAAKASAKWTQGNFALWGAYEMDMGLVSKTEGLKTAAADGSNEGADIIYVGGSYTLGNNMLIASYGNRAESDAGSDDGHDNYLIAARHNLSKKTYGYLGYSVRDEDSGSEPSMISVGFLSKMGM